VTGERTTDPSPRAGNRAEDRDEGLSGYDRASPRVRRGVGAVVLAVILALGATVVFGMTRGGTEEVPVPEVEVVADEIFVHVGGAVRAPGLYRLPAGARVVDAIAAAMGFAEGAARDAVNLARIVSDGEQLVVPEIAAEGADAGGPAPGPPGDGRVNLNTATAAELDTLPRIGPALAQRIIQWRETNGRFTSVDDLLAVAGIGEKMLDSLRELVSV